MSQVESFSIEVLPPTAPIEFGRRFDLTIRRRWPIDHVVDAFDSNRLEPLRVARVTEDRRKTGTFVESTLRLHAWALESGKLEIEALEHRAAPRDGGVVRVTRSRPIVLEVTPIEFDRAIELPRDVFPAPGRRTWVWLVAIGAVLGTAAIVMLRRHGVRARAVRVEDHNTRTRRELAELRSRELTTADEWHEESRALSSLLRGWLEARYEIPATRQTTEEFLRTPETHAAIPPPQRAALEDFLEQTDRIKFARHIPSDGTRQALYRSADTILD